MQQATADLDGIVQDLRRQYPEPNPDTAKVVSLRAVMFGDVRPIMLMFMSGAGLLLVIACINVISLLLARSDSRMREIAVRNALGATSPRLLLQFATEAAILVVAGSVIGWTLATWAMRFLRSLLSPDMMSRMPYLQEVGLTVRVIGFAWAVSLIAAVVS
jgi:ABC-type antimicrobial peptide transport system permease subunit